MITDIYNNLLIQNDREIFYTLYKTIFSIRDNNMEIFLRTKKLGNNFDGFVRDVLSKSEHLTEDIINNNKDINWNFENIAKLSWITKEVVDRNPNWDIKKHYIEHWCKKLLISIKVPFLDKIELNIAVEIHNIKCGNYLRTIIFDRYDAPEIRRIYYITKITDDNYEVCLLLYKYARTYMLDERKNLTFLEVIKDSMKYKNPIYHTI